MIMVPGSRVSLPADAIESRPTRSTAAWQGEIMTVILNDDVDLPRFTSNHSSRMGEWYALDAGTLDRRSLAARYALPSRRNRRFPALRFADVWRLPRGTVLNVGRCAPLFAQPGGGFQAEWLDGPLPSPVWSKGLTRAGR